MKNLFYNYRNNLYFLSALAISLLAGASFSPLLAQSDGGDEEGMMPEMGAYIDASDGGFINIRIVGNNFHLYFLDAEKKLIEPTYKRALIRYENVARKDRDERLILNLSADGQSLTSGRVVRPPFNFWVTLHFYDNNDSEKRIPYGRHRVRQ